ncbi:S-adenosyl-L-methionine-dependent methyltransferase [Obba rivulosa]|uniref:S-adenosyl-L-methionine-dependent methyltransferase n=1 Tax=Obba rivulosa TaxID=1052685 RepID=A0A8E2AVY5_9APHY|nr:S-adenosyl-L-methionine-dependent methyltransferase [Obba rivulosa]
MGKIPHQFSAVDELDALQNSLNQALNAVRDELDVHRLPKLSNFALEPHPLDEPTFICPPRLYEARRLALATIGQLKSLLQRPYDKVVEQSTAVYQTACLDLVVKTGILDKLAESEDCASGLSVLTLQNEFDMDSMKMTTVLRYLAAQGWLRETTEGAFTLTRPALELRHGRNGRKWIMTEGKPKVAMALMQQLSHPNRAWRYSRQADQTAYQIAFNTDMTLFAWLKQRPDELRQWASSVQSLGDSHSCSILNDFQWEKFAKRTLVDVGGGQGNMTISLAEMLPEATFVIQDLEEVIPLAEQNIRNRLQDPAIISRISVEVHDFFDPQPRIGDEYVFMLRHILHDWPDHACVKILANLAVAGGIKSKILIVDAVIAPCVTSTTQSKANHGPVIDDLRGISEYRPLAAPLYIPGNFGACAVMPLALGVHMMGVFNALERTMNEWTRLINEAGLRIVTVHALRGMVSIIECEVIGC